MIYLKALAIIIAASIAVALIAWFFAVPAKAQQCGIMPIKPITPIGCRDLMPMCVCDQSGMSCHWQWVCVR